jgi:phospholipid/cholesterol/gamma-HCH transport system substrate-binding protein
MVNVKEITVGLLFFGALVALGVLTIMLSDFDLFEKAYYSDIYFDQANELKVQDNVLIMGTRQGKVVDVEFFEEPIWSEEHVTELWVKATVRMDIPLKLKTDYSIAIRNANLLGGKVMDIRLGRSRNPLPPEARIVGLAVRDPVEAISEFFERNKGYVESILANVDQTVRDITGWAGQISDGKGLIGRLIYSDTLANDVETFAGGLEQFMADLNREDNTVALFTKDPDTRERVRQGVEDLAGIINDVAEGRGTLGKFVTDPTLHDNLVAISEEVKPITQRANAGEGFIGKLLGEESDALYGDVSATVANLKTYSEAMTSGDGVLAAIAFDGELTAKVKSTVTEISEVAAKVNQVVTGIQEGKGALGVLLSDEEIATKLRRIVDHMLDGLEDAREAAPLRSLGSFLFGAI